MVEVYHESLCRRYYASRFSCAYLFFVVVGLVAITVPFFLAARKRRSKRRGKMFHALCEEFNERFAGKLELVYSKKLDPRYVQRATTGAHVCTAVDRSQD